MNSFPVRSLFIVTSILISLAPPRMRAADDADTVALADTPPAVQKTINTQVADGTLGDIKRANENGKTVFDAGFTTKTGEKHGFTVAADGTLLSIEVALAATPAAVQKTIQAQAAGWQVEEVSKNTGDGKISFDVEISKDDHKKSFTVDEDGTLSSVEVTLAETPAAVQKTIQAQAGDAQVESIDKTTGDGKTSFDVEVSKDDHAKSFTVDEDGTLSAVEVALAETPAAVQKTIQAQAAGGEIESINKVTDEEGTTFDVDVTKDGLKKSFTVADDGYFLSTEVALAATPAPVQAAIQKQAPGASVKSIEENFEGDGGNSFDIVATAPDGSRKAVTLGADGALLSKAVTLDQTTPQAHATIVKQIGDGTLKSIDENFDPQPPVDTYDVVVLTKDGGRKCFTVGTGGWMRSEEVSLDQIGGAAHTTIQEKIGDGKIIRIDKAWAEKKADGVVPYEVEGRKDGKPFNFSVGPKGKFLGMDD